MALPRKNWEKEFKKMIEIREWQVVDERCVRWRKPWGMELKLYSIVLVNLDSTIGSEIKKTRPCVIISPNEMNNYLNSIVRAPLTTNLKKYPTWVSVKYNGNKGMMDRDRPYLNCCQNPNNSSFWKSDRRKLKNAKLW